MATNDRRKKRILRGFRIDEISAVDNPAQEGARAVLIKRAEPVEKGRKEQLDLEAMARLSGEIARRDGYRWPVPIMPADGARARQVGIDQAIAEIRARDGVDNVTALRKARDERPELFEDVPVGWPEPAPIAKAVEDFEAIVHRLETEEGLSGVDALREARDRHPDAFERFQAA